MVIKPQITLLKSLRSMLNGMLKPTLLALFCAALPTVAHAQIDAWHVNATAEGKFNASNGKWNYATLLDFGLQVKLWKGAHFVADGIANYMPHPSEYLSTDPLVLSNIDADSRLFRFANLGLSQQIGRFTLYGGVWSSPNYYFADEELGYFLNSLHGMQPVLGNNFDVPTYPVSALAFQVKWDILPQLSFTTTFMNGATGDKVEDEFQLGDGLSNISAFNYHTEKRTAELGMMIGKDIHGGHATSVYAYDIERLTDKFAVIGALGYYFGATKNEAPDEAENSKFNAALGGLYRFNDRNAIGIAGTYAKYDEGIDDSQVEMNYTHTIGAFSISPVLVLDNNNGRFQTIGVLRASLSLGN